MFFVFLNQVGYNQMPSQFTSPAVSQSPNMPPPVISQPNSMQPPPPSMYNSSPQPYQQQQQQMPPAPPQQQLPYQQQNQGALPEGPVGGISGYDPQLHAKMAGMSVHNSFSRLWVIFCFKYFM